MGMKEIVDYLTETSSLLDAAEEYMYELTQETNRYLKISDKNDKTYTIKATIKGEARMYEVEIVVTLKKIYKIAKKSSNIEDAKQKIDEYIERKLIKAYINKLVES